MVDHMPRRVSWPHEVAKRKNEPCKTKQNKTKQNKTKQRVAENIEKKPLRDLKHMTPKAPTAVGTQDVAAQARTASARPSMWCITIVLIDWCPWIDAQGSVCGDVEKGRLGKWHKNVWCRCPTAVPSLVPITGADII